LAEDVLASGNHWVMQFLEADGAFIAAVDAKLEKSLKSFNVLLVERNRTIRSEKGHKIDDAITAELPVTADLPHPKEDLENMPVGIQAALRPPFLKFLDHALRLGPRDN
jgi:hypothetical protein